MSLPLRGAWIEIPALTVFRFMMRCRSPCGERGLKSPNHIPRVPRHYVAPPAGSVD